MAKQETFYRIGVLLLSAVLSSSAASAATAQSMPSRPESAALAGMTADWRTAVSRVARDNIPAVVHIEVIERRGVPSRLKEAQSDRPPEPFFGGPALPRQFKPERRGLGSGMIIDADGHILTNAHVVGGASDIEVLLASGEKYVGRVIGVDAKTDLAVIKIPGGASLQQVSFGDSDSLEVGEWVIAIGHPRGLDQTVTQGIISAKHRRGITDPTSYGDFLQTDAAINPGNSGGPLLNLAGQVIGVNARIASSSGGSEGIGFAIPSNMARHIAQQLIAKGRVERGWLGVTTQPLSPEIARKLALPTTEGALIVGVVAGGPAAAAGLKPGQVVVACNGEPVRDDLGLRNKIVDIPPGKTLTLRVFADGTAKDLSVTIGDLDAVTKARIAWAEGRLGLKIREITAEESELYKLRPGNGVVVVDLDPKGALAAQGLQVGDVILEIRAKPIDGPEIFGLVAAALTTGEEVPVLAVDHRTGEPGYLQFTPP